MPTPLVMFTFFLIDWYLIVGLGNLKIFSPGDFDALSIGQRCDGVLSTTEFA